VGIESYCFSPGYFQHSNSPSVSNVIRNQRWLPFSGNYVPSIAADIKSLALPILPYDDSLIWEPSKDGTLSFGDCFALFDELSSPSQGMKFIWKSFIPPKLSTLAWRIFHLKLPTDDALRKRGFYLTSACLLCDTLHCEETLDHLFLHCSFAQRSWSWIMSLFNTSLAFSTWQQFWHSIFSKRFSPQIYNLWMVACLMMIFLIWKARNKLRFDDVKPVFSQICSHALATLRRLGTFLPGFVFPSTDSFILNKMGIPVHLCRAPKVYNVIWKKPTFPWLKVNTDGLSKEKESL